MFLVAFPGLYDTWDAIAIWLAILTMVGANLVALVQGNVKRMLAYSSIAHAGYLLVALAAASTLGAASFLFSIMALPRHFDRIPDDVADTGVPDI